VNNKRAWRLYESANLSLRKRCEAKRATGELELLAASRHINET